MKIFAISSCNQNRNINKINQTQLQTKSIKSTNIQTFTPIYNTPAFGISPLQVAQRALKQLEKHIESGTKLTDTDEKWLRPFREKLGTESLTVKEVNKGNNLQAVYDATKVMIGATKYKPISLKVGEVNLKVHNRMLAPMLRENYSKNELANIVAYLNKHHVFDMSDNPNYGLVVNHERGLVRTCGAAENWEMSERAWITDTMRVGDIHKRKKPQTWTKALNTVASYYDTQQKQFRKYILNPQLYYLQNPMEGIPHIFMPKTLEPDTGWFNNKRLESHGLALKEFCLAMTDGLVHGKKHGYQSAKGVPDTVYNAVDNLSKYFKAIKYEQAPSAGNWEEIPLQGGLTSDTATIRSGLVAFRNLMYNPKYNKNQEVQKARERFRELDVLSKKDLDVMIDAGEKRVRATYLAEAPNIRPHDASLAFITTSDIKLADDVMEDVKKHTEILTSLEKNLVGENGIRRYAPFKFILKDGSIEHSPDSYLNLNYFNAVDKNGKVNLKWKELVDSFGSKDCSDPQVFAERAKLSTPNREAQWFMVSEMSTGYGKQIEKLVKNAKKEQRALNDKETQMVEYLKKKQTEYLNRALARMSDENPEKIHQLKANGHTMSTVTLSEAHQYVSDTNGQHKMIQGINAPLAWAVASLYKAVKEQGKVIDLFAT